MQEIAQINTHFCDIFAAPLVQTGFRIQIDVIMTSTTLEGRGCDFGGFAGWSTLNDFWPLLLFLHNHSSMLFLHFLFLCYFFVSFHFSERLLFHPWFSRHLSSIDQWYFHDYFSNPTFEIFLPIDYSLYCVLDNILLIFHSTSHFHRTCIDAFMISFLFPFFYAFSTPFFHHFFSFSFVFHFFSFSFLSFPYQFLINSLSSLSIPSLALWTLSIVQRTGTPKWMISRICSNQKDSSRHVSSFSLFLLGEYFSIVLIVLIVLLLVHGLPLLLLFRREGLCHGTEELEKFTEERLTTTTQTCSSMWFYNDSSLYSMVVLYSLFKYLNFFVPSLLGSYP